MRAATALFFSSLLASALAYQVTKPTKTTGWTSSGAQTLTWTMVSTDQDTFAAVLDNQINPSLLANGPVVLKENVAGSSGSLSLDPPSGGWVVGNGYRINLVKDAKSLTTILAQSDQFNITAGTGSSTTGSTTGTSTGSNTSSTAKTSTTGTTGGSTGTGPNSDSTDTADPAADTNKPNGAIRVASSVGAAGAFGLAALLMV